MDVNRSQGGSYECSAHNVAGTVNRSITLNILSEYYRGEYEYNDGHFDARVCLFVKLLPRLTRRMGW